ncbi:MAG: HAMP domain-containing methyl-accepting chemotaxis protein [Candidatus Nitrosocaldaceae archaeon]
MNIRRFNLIPFRRRTLLSLILSSAVGIVAFYIISYSYTEQILRDTSFNLLTTEVHGITLFIKGNIIDKNLEIDVRESIEHNSINGDYILLDSKGKVIQASENSIIGRDMSNSREFIDAKNGKSVFFDKLNDQTVIKSIIPINSNIFNGVFIKIDSIDKIQNRLIGSRDLGASVESYIVNSDRFIITESRFIEDAQYNIKVDTLPVKECFENGKSITSIYDDYRGIPVAGASSCMSDLGIVILTEIDTAELFAPIQSIQIIFIIASISIIGGVIIFGTFITKRLSKPLVTIAKAASSIGEGDLTTDISLKYEPRDEISNIISGFNYIRDNFTNIISKIRRSSNNISNAISDVKRSTEHVNIAMQQISTSSQNQAHQMEESSKLLNDMRESTRALEEKFSIIIDLSNNMNISAVDGNKSASKAAESIANIMSIANETSDKIKELVEKTNKITEVLEVIHKIAEQTNLLALNAAIEAARAGENGRGFAVVAEEVRGLAQKTERSSEEISSIIEEIQGVANKTVVNIDSGKERIIKSKDVIEEALNILKDISKQTVNIEAKIKECSSYIKNQSNIVDNISEKISHIAAGSEENAAAVEEIGASIEEINSKMQMLHEEGLHLNELFKSFNIKEETKSDVKVEPIIDNVIGVER